MKIYTYIKYLGITLAFLSSGSLFTSCTNEELTGPSYPKGEGGVTLNITLPDPITIDPMTRAGAADFNKINDLNVVIADGETIENIYYYDGSNTDETGPTFTTTNGEPEVHLSKEYVKTNDLTSKSIYIVANYGKNLRTEHLNNVSAMRNLKQSSSDTP